MAMALHSSRNDNGPNILPAMYTGHPVMTELDFQDERYPSPLPHSNAQRTSALLFGANEKPHWEDFRNSDDSATRRLYDSNDTHDVASPAGAPEQSGNQGLQHCQQPQSRISATSADIQSLKSQSQSQSQSFEPQRNNTLSYALPAGPTRRVVERYSLDDNEQRAPSRASANSKLVVMSPEPSNAPFQSPMGRSSPLPASAQRPTSPIAVSQRGSNDYPIIPLAASPSYNPPVAPKHRAYAQQPTYITPPTTPTPVKPVYAQQPPPREEICVECAMRDEEMADVDVTSPGVWERESDAAFEELRIREEEDEANGVVRPNDPKRPRAKGGRLTEQNLKLWLSINPREPTARQQTLRSYVKSQRMLLEAETMARNRAMKEAKQLDNQMRDTYSQLRRSAYDLGNASSPADNTGGVRIKPPLSPTSPVHNTHVRSHSREITLLENGMIVEHVDVRKEEREARERKKKEERRARKSSRGSTMDVTSIISANSLGVAQTDGGYSLRPNSPYAPAPVRPTSAFTAPIDRPELPRAYSQASFSDVHSMGSASPRRTTRFFGFRNLSAGWRSQDSLAAASGIQSGSMIDMHLALQREGQQSPLHGTSPPGSRSAVRSQIWPSDHSGAQVTKKKKKGFARIWGMVTGAGKQPSTAPHETPQLERLEKQEDNLPLAPPPPLSFLVDRRGSHELRAANGRHGSTPSLPSLASPKLNASVTPGMSPSTGSSSVFSFPASSRTSGPDVDIADARKTSGNLDDLDGQFRDDTMVKGQPVSKNVHSVVSEPDISQYRSRNMSPPPSVPLTTSPNGTPSRPASILLREKSLPPLPIEAGTRQPSINTLEPVRPQTMYTYDPRQLPPGSAPAHDFLPPSAPYRTADVRRQSFGGLSSRPNLFAQTVPANGAPRVNPMFGSSYDEFGYSRRSLGPLDNFKDTIPVQQTFPTKRKHKFGLASLLRRKSTSRDPKHNDTHLAQYHQFPLMRQTELEGQDDVRLSGYTTSVSKHSALSAHGPPTHLSVTSRKALEERVAQDPQFVAYRYPSNDQHLEFLR